MITQPFSGPDADARLNGLRVLEIGDRSLFFAAHPGSTTLLWTGLNKIAPGPGRRNFGPGSVVFLLQALRRQNRFDLIVCHAPLYPPLGPRTLLRLLGRRPLSFASCAFRGCGVLFLRLAAPRAVIAVLDTEDFAAVNRHNVFLFARCRAFFKRELPPDHWKVFAKTVHPNLPTARFRKNRFYRRCVEKMRPISLGVPTDTVRQTANVRAAEKSTDVFFAGTLSNSLVRARGVEQLRALQDEGYVIDVAAEANLPRAEYYARCARAWLTWSPEGFGWDCFRHYEAPLCGSVPLINQPTIFRYQPLRQNVHCVYYDVEGDGLQTAVRQALRDKPRLGGMARAARDHVLRHHTHERLCAYVVETALGTRAAAEPPA